MKARLPDGCLLSQQRLSESVPAIDLMETRHATTATVFANDVKIHQNFKKKKERKKAVVNKSYRFSGTRNSLKLWLSTHEGDYDL